jgi:hypothetical protein
MEWMETEKLIEPYVHDFDDAIQGILDYDAGKTASKFVFRIGSPS